MSSTILIKNKTEDNLKLSRGDKYEKKICKDKSYSLLLKFCPKHHLKYNLYHNSKRCGYFLLNRNGLIVKTKSYNNKVLNISNVYNEYVGHSNVLIITHE